MVSTEQQVSRAEARTQETQRGGYAVAARYDRRAACIVVRLNSDLELAFPAGLAEARRRSVHSFPFAGSLRFPELDGPSTRRLRWAGLLTGQNDGCAREWSQGWQAAEVGNRGITQPG